MSANVNLTNKTKREALRGQITDVLDHLNMLVEVLDNLDDDEVKGDDRDSAYDEGETEAIDGLAAMHRLTPTLEAIAG